MNPHTRTLIEPPRPNRRIPLDPFEQEQANCPPIPVRQFNWLRFFTWLGAILFCLACWAGVLVFISWWVTP